jgi:hypothetical protein
VLRTPAKPWLLCAALSAYQVGFMFFKLFDSAIKVRQKSHQFLNSATEAV